MDAVLPHIAYRDVAEAITWLTNAFGFIEYYRYGEPDGEVGGAQMRAGNRCIMLKRARTDFATPAQVGQLTQSLTIFVEDVASHFAKAKSSGARIIEDLHETIYGELQYGVEDLDGHRWLFSQHARNVNPADWGATVSQPAGTLTQVSPMLAVSDGNAAIEFYKAAFGVDSQPSSLGCPRFRPRRFLARLLGYA